MAILKAVEQSKLRPAKDFHANLTESISSPTVWRWREGLDQARCLLLIIDEDLLSRRTRRTWFMGVERQVAETHSAHASTVLLAAFKRSCSRP